MNKFFIHTKYLILILVVLILYGTAVLREQTVFDKTDFAMDTVISIKAKGFNAKKASTLALNKIHELDNTMSAYKSGSDLVNKDLSPETVFVVKKALYYSKISGGLYDITIKPLVDLWNITGENPHVPKESDIKEAAKKVGYEKLTIKNGKINMPIDLGSIAKGYAADKAAEILKQYGIKDAVLNLGGDIYAIGEKKIGIRDPFGKSDSSYMAILNVKDCAVVTSGVYERFFIENGVRYHHIINPKTGYPQNSGLVSATIIADNSTDADALSTIVFMMGGNGIDFAKKQGVKAITIDENHNVRTTGDIALEIIDPAFKIID